MKRFFLVLSLTPIIFTNPTIAQSTDRVLTVVVRGGYTTSSKVFYNPEASSADIRAQYNALEGIFGGGIEVRYHWPEFNFFLTLSAEYLSKHRDQTQILGFSDPPLQVPFTEGFVLIPIELGANVYIPVGSEKFRVSMGGGIGAYYGEQLLTVAGIKAAMRNRPLSVGIHVESGVEYRVLPGIWLRGDMRFRDPEVRSVIRFEKLTTQYQGSTLTFSNNDFKTRIDVDGMSFGLGIVVEVF